MANLTETKGDPAGWVKAACVILLVLHFLLAVGSKLHESTTADEIAHLTGGLGYWTCNDYRFQPENGNLAQRWVALPAWLAGRTLPGPTDDAAWHISNVWAVGHRFFYGGPEDHFPILMAGRMMEALFSVATGILVFAWSRRLFGDRGALLSLGFFAFCPNFLAHGALATSDVCMTFFILAFLSAWWRHLHNPGAGPWALSACVFGLACVAKYSAVLLLPMMAILALVRALSPEPLELGGRIYRTAVGKLTGAGLSLLVHAAVAAAVIWAFYGFRFSAFNPHLPRPDGFLQPLARDLLGWKGAILDKVSAWHLLPEAFIYGFGHVLATSHQRAAYLNGEYSIRGWPTFFPWAFVLKTTVPLMLAGLIAWVVAFRRWAGNRETLKRDLYRVAPLLALLGVYGGVSLASHLNIGLRHLLPLYPVLFIAVGILAAPRIGRGMATIALLLLGWHAAEAAWISPHFIAYFNELGGGPKAGWRHLVDSSLDWGQDLPGLKVWLDQNTAPGESVYVSYEGSAEPSAYGLRAYELACVDLYSDNQTFVRLRHGVYCIGASRLVQLIGPLWGPWTPQAEQRFQKLLPFEDVFEAYTHPSLRPEIERSVPREVVLRTSKEFQELQFCRLCYYLRLRKPDAQVGYSIMIYRLTAAQVEAAADGSLNDWNHLLERTRQDPGR